MGSDPADNPAAVEALAALLASLRGAPGRRELPALRRPLLLVLDLQRLFCEPGSPAYTPGWERALATCRRLVPLVGRRGGDVAFTRHAHAPGDGGGSLRFFFRRLQRPDDPLCALAAEVEPLARAGRTIVKGRFSALSAPEVEAAARRADAVLIAGVRTDQCVLATALDAARQGLRAVVLADGCASMTPERHAAALRVLAQGHAHVATKSEVVAAMELAEGEAGGGHARAV